MKTLKRAEQKNVAIDTEMYSLEELKKIMNDFQCFFWIYNEEDHKSEYYYSGSAYEKMCGYCYQSDPQPVRLFITDQVKELKVIYEYNYGFYQTVAIMNDNSMIYVKL